MRWLPHHQEVTLELAQSANMFCRCRLDSAVDGALLASFLHSVRSANRARACCYLIRSTIFHERLRKRAAEFASLSAASQDQDGPLVSKKQRQSVADYVKIGLDEGAELVMGGSPSKWKAREGSYYGRPSRQRQQQHADRARKIFGRCSA